MDVRGESGVSSRRIHTALSDETVRARLLAEGAVACLFKPFSETALLEALHAALHGR
jgi:CheY-like chemotaxis protein